MDSESAQQAARQDPIRELAHRLGCASEEEVQQLVKLKPGTLESWRKHGKGPSYILFGNAFLYPFDGLGDHLRRLIRERAGPPGKALL